MRNIVLSQTFRNSRSATVRSSLLYPGLYTFRAASVSRAIDRGIRRSKGVGFRGKEKTQSDAPRHGARDSPIRRTADPPLGIFSTSKLTRSAWKGSAQKTAIPLKKPDLFSKESRRGRFGEVLKAGPAKIRIGKRVLIGGEEERHGGESDNSNTGYGKRGTRRGSETGEEPFRAARLGRGDGGRSTEPRENRRSKSRADPDRPHWELRGKSNLRGIEPQERSSSVATYPPLSATKSSYTSGNQDAREPRSLSGSNRGQDNTSREPSSSGNYSVDSFSKERGQVQDPASQFLSTEGTSRDSRYPRNDGREQDYNSRDPKTNRPSVDSGFIKDDGREWDYLSRDSNIERNATGESPYAHTRRGREAHFNDRTGSFSRGNDNDSSPSRVAKFTDKRMPISIPYTTSASEFLYGTSVVEAALNCKNLPRRKHYKLYIFNGEKRENVVRDADLERLARRSGVEVARVGSDWLPLLDKMSGSRPHNGYILETSPLPRLPVTSLGELTERDDSSGFKVKVDYQSREDAAINGTSDFVRVKKTKGRKPLVLFLDSILDPGNLGNIIRTASFLGATAVAVSKNCTAFSPIVLKASAGASENITLFTVNKPAGFIADSKVAGWKIFAAVAPSGSNASSVISTDDLADPLSEDPCILMLGAEGEGLRMNLRSKADFQLSIRGSGQSHSVDSLNVSVATGILCNAFLKRSSPRETAALVPARSLMDEHEENTPDLF